MDIVKGGGRAPPPPPMMEWLYARKRPLPLCVYSVAKTTTNRAQQTEQGHSVHTGGYFQLTRTKLRVFFTYLLEKYVSIYILFTVFVSNMIPSYCINYKAHSILSNRSLDQTNIQRRWTWTGDFKCREVKTGFCRKRLTQTGSSGTLIGWKSGQTTFIPLWDRMEGAWLWTLWYDTSKWIYLWEK